MNVSSRKDRYRSVQIWKNQEGSVGRNDCEIKLYTFQNYVFVENFC